MAHFRACCRLGAIVPFVIVGCSNADPSAQTPVGQTAATPVVQTTASAAVEPTPDILLALAAIDYGELVVPGSVDQAVKRMAVGKRPSTPGWVGQVEDIQRAVAAGMSARKDFAYEDRQSASGITFQHRITPDSALNFRSNHYDHGNGVVAADIDLDGWTDLFFVSQIGPNGLWRNRGDGTFEDVTDQAGVGMADKVKVSASFADLDNDGDPDLMVTSTRSSNTLFANDGAGRFRDVTDSSGLDYEGHSSGVDFFDYDRDGLLDVFVSNIGRFTTDTIAQAPLDPFSTSGESGSVPYFEGDATAFTLHEDPDAAEPSRLYRNLGDLRFVDVTEESGLLSDNWSGDAIPMDGNEDGWSDLYVLNMQGEDAYYENNKVGAFEDKSRTVFMNTPFGSTGGTALDVENDGRQDLFVVDMHSDMTENLTPARDSLKARKPIEFEPNTPAARMIPGNALYHRVAPNEFTEASDRVGLESMWPWGVSAGDLNADGFEDLFVTSSMNASFRYHPDHLYLNESGTRFFRADAVLGVDPRPGNVVFQPWFTVDCSEDRDNVVCDGTGLAGVQNVWEAAGSRSSVIFDLERDGDLDIVTNSWNAPPRVLVSDLSSRAGVNLLAVRLVGSASNRDGIGARVTVHSGGKELTQVLDGQSGYLSQSSLPLYFGLGEATSAERIDVVWPDGATQTVEGPFASGDEHTIREPDPVGSETG